MWGLLAGVLGIGTLWRFTPTYVGTSISETGEFTAYAVHPHVCGDFDVAVAVCHFVHGSPPRMWGLRAGGIEAGAGRRFTPTYVGTSNIVLKSVTI